MLTFRKDLFNSVPDSSSLGVLKSVLDRIHESNQKQVDSTDQLTIINSLRSEELLSSLTGSLETRTKAIHLFERSLKVLGTSEQISKIANAAIQVLATCQNLKELNSEEIDPSSASVLDEDNDETVRKKEEVALYLIKAVTEENFESTLLNDIQTGKIPVDEVLTFAFIKESYELIDVVIQSFQSSELEHFVFPTGFYQGLTFAQAFLTTPEKDRKKPMGILNTISCEQWVKPISSSAIRWLDFNGWTPLLFALDQDIRIPSETLKGLKDLQVDWSLLLTYPSNESQEEEFQELSGDNVLYDLVERKTNNSLEHLAMLLNVGCPVSEVIRKVDLWNCVLSREPFHEGLLSALIANNMEFIPFKALIERGCDEAILRILDHDPSFALMDLVETLKDENLAKKEPEEGVRLDGESSLIEASQEVDRVSEHRRSISRSEVQENTRKVLQELCAGNTQSSIDLLALLIKGYYQETILEFLDENELWEAAINCCGLPNNHLMKVLVELGIPGAPDFQNWFDLRNWPNLEDKEKRYAAFLSANEKLDEIKIIDQNHSQTPLCEAIVKNQISLVQCLLNERANPNQGIVKNGKTVTPLDLALELKHYDAATALIHSGAAIDHIGKTTGGSKQSSISFALEKLIDAYHTYHDESTQIGPGVIPSGNDVFLFAVEIFNRHSIEELNNCLTEGIYRGQTPLQVVLENRLWGAVRVLCRRKVDVGAPFSVGPYSGCSALQVIFLLACSINQRELKSKRSDLKDPDCLSAVKLKEAILSVCLAAQPEDLTRNFRALEGDQFYRNLTVVHLAIFAGIKIPLGILQNIVWPNLILPHHSICKGEKTGDLLLFILKRDRVKALPKLSHLIRAGAPITPELLTELFDLISECNENEHLDKLREVLVVLALRKISLDRPLKNGKTLSEHFFDHQQYFIFIFLVGLGAHLTSEEMLNTAIGDLFGLITELLDTEELEKAYTKYPELERGEMTPALFFWLSHKFPPLPLLLLENSYFRELVEKTPPQELKLPQLPMQSAEYFDETVIRSIIQYAGSSLLVTRYLLSCPKAGWIKSGSLFPLAASLLGFGKTLKIVEDVLSKTSIEPLRISLLLNAFIEEIGEENLKEQFLKEGGSIENYVIQRADGFVLSKAHLEQSLDHPLVAQPDPGWNFGIIGNVVKGAVFHDLDELCSQAVKTEFLNLLDGIAVEDSHEARDVRDDLRQGLEASLDDLLKPRESTTIAAPRQEDQRIKSYQVILHFLSHILVHQKALHSKPTIEERNQDVILNLAEALARCIPRRFFESSRTYGKVVKGKHLDYKSEWTANLAYSRLDLNDLVVARVSLDPEENIHTLTNIVVNLGRELALPGYMSSKDDFEHFVDNFAVKDSFFSLYCPYRIVAKTVIDLKDPEMRTLYEKHWSDKSSKDWEEAWFKKNQMLVDTLRLKIAALTNKTDAESSQALLKEQEKTIKELRNQLETVSKVYSNDRTLLLEITRNLHAALAHKVILSQSPAQVFLSELENHIPIPLKEIEEILNSPDSEVLKQQALIVLLNKGLAHRALHEHLWEDVYVEGELVQSYPKGRPLYATLEEFGAFTIPSGVL